MNEAHEVEPLIAVPHRGDGPFAVETPDFVEDRFQPDAVLVDRPELDRGVGEGGRDFAEERADLFVNSACAAGSACTGRGRGLRRRPSRRTR